MQRPKQPWSREEVDRLEAMLQACMRYSDIAEALGRSWYQVAGAVDRHGLSDSKRRIAHISFTPERKEFLREKVRECIEVRGMTCRDTHKYLAAIGERVSYNWVYTCIQSLDRSTWYAYRQNISRKRSFLTRMQKRREKR